MTDHSLGRRTRAPAAPRPWYHRPDWIIALIAAITLATSAVVGTALGSAQTAQNTSDIKELKAKVDPVPERLAHIETKIDDLTTFEKRRAAAE